MRTLFAICAACLAATPALAEPVQLNHLDCIPSADTKALVCPEVMDGRSAAEPVVEAAIGSSEWNALCAAKYKSFDPATGNYTSYRGRVKPCR
jgi:hypothetical protein